MSNEFVCLRISKRGVLCEDVNEIFLKLSTPCILPVHHFILCYQNVHNMLNTYIYHQLLLTCFGACYTIFRENIALLAEKLYDFAMLLQRLCCKMCNIPRFLNLQCCYNVLRKHVFRPSAS